MKKSDRAGEEDIQALHDRLLREAESSGYHLNPDTEFTRALAEGLLVNQSRYGYRACPCRLASGNRPEDTDIICPCDYRDTDLDEYGCCFCGLYVTSEVLKGEKDIGSIPDRRKAVKGEKEKEPVPDPARGLPYPVWRCKVCGYLCAREHPPQNCPVCKADKERFEKFM